MSGNFYGQAFFGGGFFNGSSPAAQDPIRNFSLRNWKHWKREELEEGDLPEPLRVEADVAIRQAQQAAVAQAQAKDTTDRREALLKAMEAREAYEKAYREAYRDAYVAEIVAELWRQDMKRAERRRKAALLLLH